MRCALLTTFTPCTLGLHADHSLGQWQVRVLGAVAQAVSMWKRLVGPYPLMQPRVGEATILAFAISASAAFALAVLFLWHGYLILTAQVSIALRTLACAYVHATGCCLWWRNASVQVS